MKQGIHAVLPFDAQVAVIYAGTNGWLDDLPVKSAPVFEQQVLDALETPAGGGIPAPLRGGPDHDARGEERPRCAAQAREDRRLRSGNRARMPLRQGIHRSPRQPAQHAQAERRR